MIEDPFAALRESRTNEDEEIVSISTAPDFESLKRWLEARGEREHEIDDQELAYYFSGAPVVADGKGHPNPLGETEGHRLVRLINESRSEIPGPHATNYRLRCPRYDLGQFDRQDPQLHVVRGGWWPDIELAMTEALGGGFTRYWNRWEHHFQMAGSVTAVTYWFNEFLYLGEAHMHLLVPDNREVALVVTAPADALDAAEKPLADLAARAAAEADDYVAPEPVWTHHESVRDIVAALRTLLPAEGRSRRPELASRANEPASEAELSAAESARRVRLPMLMRELLLASNGGSLDGEVADINQHASGVRPLGGLDHTPWFYDGVGFPDPWKPIRPLSLLVPFTGDGHADVCLDYRRRGPNAEPHVTLVDTESEVERLVADSFPEYVSKMATVGFQLPAAPGTTAEQIVKQLRTAFDNVEVEERPSRGFLVKANDEPLCWILDGAIPEYGDCETTVEVNHPQHLEVLVRSLVGADLLEGSIPLQSWDPTLWD